MVLREGGLAAFSERLNRAVSTKRSEAGAQTFDISGKTYLDEGQFHREQDLIRHAWLPVMPLGELEPGTMRPAYPTGKRSALVSMDTDQGVHVFANQCRHRAAKLNCTSNSKAAVCPYHGWVYDCRGRLKKVPGRQHGFERGELSSMGLRELPSRTLAAWVWSGSGPTPNDNGWHVLDQDFATIGVDRPTVLEQFQINCASNWKLVVEAFLEIYHFRAAHARTLPNLELHDIALFDFYGSVTRIAVPQKLAASASIHDILASCDIEYFIFPNTFFLVFIDHIVWFSIDPLDPTSSVLNYRGLAFNPRPPECVREKVAQSAHLLNLVMREDLTICEGIQETVSFDSTLRLTRTEHAIERFHQELTRLSQA